MFGFFKKVDFNESLYKHEAEYFTLGLKIKEQLIIKYKFGGPLSSKSFGNLDSIGNPESKTVLIEVQDPYSAESYDEEFDRSNIIHLFWWLLSTELEKDTRIKINKQTKQQKLLIMESSAKIADQFMFDHNTLRSLLRKERKEWKKPCTNTPTSH